MDHAEQQTAIERKLAQARTRLILDKPFLGALVLRLPMVAADWCRTTATDARALYYNPAYAAELRPEEAQFVMAHEALHCALLHFSRRGHRRSKLWDIACDFAINPLLIHEGLKAPPGSLVEDRFQGMTAEEIYPCLDDSWMENETLDEHLYEGDDGEGQQQPQRPSSAGQSKKPEDDPTGKGSGRPPPLSATERDALSVQWRQRLAGAAQQAREAGKLDGEMGRLVDHLLQPQLPWRMMLSRYVSAIARDDYSYTRPSNRRGEPAIYPALRSGQLNLVVALDVSGSITESEMREFLSEIDAIKAHLRARLVLHACDARLVTGSPWTFEPWEAVEFPGSIPGGGGTRFTPVFDWIAAQDMPPDLLLYFTDAQGEFPKIPPNFPVIWLVKGRTPVPFGQRVQLN